MARRQSNSQTQGTPNIIFMDYHIDFNLDFKRNPFKGKFIVIEGIDAAGKTTQVHDLAKALEKRGEKVHLTKNPTDGEIGKFIRRVLTGKTKIPPVSFQFLFAADRHAQQQELLKHLKKGEIVISDRYFWSALAYGIVDREGVALDRTGTVLLVSQAILSMYDQHLIPDKTLYLDIPVSLAVERLNRMSKTKELYEEEDKLLQIDKAYKWLIKQFPKEITVIDGTKSEKEITDLVLSLVQSAKK